MKKLINLLSIIIVFVMMSCEDNNGDSSNNEMPIKEVTTRNVNDAAYYFNLAEGSQNANLWHLAYQNMDVGGGFAMPSFSLSNSAMLAVESSMDFESIQNSPAPNSFAPEGGRMQYGGSNSALTYNMTTHQVSVSSDTYIIYDTVSHKVFKVHFDDYSSGVVIFRYAELTSK